MLKLLFIFILNVVVTCFVFAQGKMIPQLGHQGRITHAKFSDNGKWLATGGQDRVILLWDMQTGLHWTLTGHSGIIMSIAFNNDASLLATSDGRGQVILWNVADKTIKKQFAIENQIVAGLTFLPNGKEIYYSSKKLYKWNFIKNQHTKYEMSGFRGNANFVITYDGRIAIGASQKTDYIQGQLITSNKFEFYDLKSKKFIYNANITKHGSAWNGITISKDGKYLALVNDKKALIVTYPKGKIVQKFTLSGEVTQMTFTANNSDLLISSSNGKITFANLTSGKMTSVGGITAADVVGGRMAYDPKNELIVGIQETDLVFYDIKQKEIFKIFTSGNAGIYDISWDEKAKKLWALTFNSVVEWDIASLNVSNATFSTKNNTGSNFGLSKEKKSISEEPYKYFNRESNVAATDISNLSSKYKIVKSAQGESFANTFYGFKILDRNSGSTIAKKDKQDEKNYPVGIAINDKYAFVSTVNALTIYELPSLAITKKIDYKRGVPSTLKISPDGNTLVVGKTSESVQYGVEKPLSFDIELYDIKTLTKKGVLKGHYSTVNSFAFSADGSKLFSGSWDGTIRVWDLKTNKEIALLHGSSKKHYFITTPEGYFSMSKNAIKNMAFSSSSAIYPASIFEAKMNRPDKVATALGFTPSSLQKAFLLAYNKRIKRLGIDESPINLKTIPTISILNSNIPKSTSKTKLKFTIAAKSSVGKMQFLKMKINNIPEFGKNGLSINSNSYKKEFEIELSQGLNNVSISVVDEKGQESLPSTFSIKCNKTVKPDLYLVTIGVSKFHNSEYNLTYASKDANDVQSFFQEKKDSYNQIHLKQFNDSQAIRDRILESKSFFKDAKVDDEVIVFVASHGLLDDKMDYYLATTDMIFENPAAKGLKYEDLESFFSNTKSRNRLMLIDACHSGEVDKEDTFISEAKSNTLVKGVKSRGFKTVKSKATALGLKNSFQLMKEVFADTRDGIGATVISSASGTEFAYESAEWNNGVFTYALINGLKSKKTDVNRDEKISVSELKSYVFEKVDKLTNGKQHPTSRIENIENDFTVISLTDSEVINFNPTGRYANEYIYYSEKRKKYMEIVKNGIDINVYFESMTDYNKEWQKSKKPTLYKKIAPNTYKTVSGGVLIFTKDGVFIDKDAYNSDYDATYNRVD